jgi:hypothetical protein
MKALAIQCPHCTRRCECEVAQDIHVLLLHCPSCHRALLQYYGHAFPIEDRELKHLETRGHVKATDATIRLVSAESKGHGIGEPVLDHAIAEEDIINLRIDLARARDVNEFLSLL